MVSYTYTVDIHESYYSRNRVFVTISFAHSTICFMKIGILSKQIFFISWSSNKQKSCLPILQQQQQPDLYMNIKRMSFNLNSSQTSIHQNKRTRPANTCTTMHYRWSIAFCVQKPFISHRD